LGLLIGGGIEIGAQIWKGGKVSDWRAVSGKAAQGAIVGFATGLAGPVGYSATAGIGAAANVVGGAVNKTIQGQEITTEGALTDAASGAVGAAGGLVLAKGVSTVVSLIAGRGTGTAVQTVAVTESTVTAEAAAPQAAVAAGNAVEETTLMRLSNEQIRGFASDRLKILAELFENMAKGPNGAAYNEVRGRVLAEMGRRAPATQMRNMPFGKALTKEEIKNIKLTGDKPDVPGIPGYNGLKDPRARNWKN
jgi:hypothetical protein